MTQQQVTIDHTCGGEAADTSELGWWRAWDVHKNPHCSGKTLPEWLEPNSTRDGKFERWRLDFASLFEYPEEGSWPLGPHCWTDPQRLRGADTGLRHPRSVSGSLPGRSGSRHPRSAAVFVVWQAEQGTAHTQVTGAGRAKRRWWWGSHNHVFLTHHNTPEQLLLNAVGPAQGTG